MRWQECSLVDFKGGNGSGIGRTENFHLGEKKLRREMEKVKLEISLKGGSD